MSVLGRTKTGAAMAGLMLCLCCAPLPALAGQSIVWNGAGAPGTTGEIRPSSWMIDTLYSDGPSGNSVTVNADLPSNTHIYGGSDLHTGSANAAAANNHVIINSGASDGSVIGSRVSSDSGSAMATDSSVTINGGLVQDIVFGAYVDSGSGSATATGNSVTINDGSMGNSVYGSYLFNSSSSATAAGNSVTINDGSVDSSVHGSYLFSGSGSATATGNSVTINGGTVDRDIYGSETFSGSGSATATGNSVTLNGGSVDGNVYGGFASNIPGSAAATGNSVTLNGGSVGRNVYGGYASSDSGSARATGNSITLSGSLQFAQTSRLYGGENGIMSMVIGDAFSGNTLNVWNYTGSAVAGVQNFQHYNFVLPAVMQNGGTLLTVTDTAVFDDSKSSLSSGVKSSITGVNIMGGGAALQAGESVTLMRYATLGNNAYAVNGNGRIRGQKGIFLLYDFQLSQTATALNATVTGVRAHPQAKALSEGRLAGLAFVNQGADLIAGSGMDAARRSAARAEGSGFAPFLALQGGTARYDTGSHVDVDGFSLLTGLAWNREAAWGKLLLGAFFEAGWGDYDSHNSFSGFASVHGEGDTNYSGGGVLGRMEFPLGPTGRAAAAQRSVIYVEGSFRAGWADTDFSSTDLRDPFLNQNASYDSGSAYYGAHLGLGYVWNIGTASSLDLHTRYSWTRQDGDSVHATDDPIHFKAADSHRVRGGARFSHALNTEKGLVFTPYLGAAWEYEFDAKAKATTYGYDLDSPDLRGGTGIGELGLSFRPSAESGLSLDLAAQGYTGVREGVSGSFQARWEF